MTDLALSLKRSGLSCWPRIRKWAPCENACPLHMNIPGFVISVAQGEFDDAYAIMRETNPFPGICGYVCHHPCENDCIRGRIDEPINSRAIHRFVVDRKLERDMIEATPAEIYRERVAVIGSGPAGLTCAHDLALLGYRVTVFEEAPVAGGMLVLGIPEFVLPRHIVEAEIVLIQRTGVEIRTGTPLGKSLSIDDLWRDGFKAVLLATGSWRSLKLDIPGTELTGVLPALQFLRDYNRGKDLNIGEKVAVIGGGNVGIDTARAALRLGAREVNLVCLECREEMPAFEWEIRIAEEEGVRVHP
ncbi:MAG: FAD-dependent oxidoreductase, partial [Dehalococcoidia bacterium]